MICQDLYLKGIEAEKIREEEQAFFYFKQSADLGHVDAQLNVANRYEKGVGTEVSRQEALFYYHLAANQGNVDAQFALGELYSQELGNKDLSRALDYYLIAANHNIPGVHSKSTLAKYKLGIIYTYGLGTEKSLEKAFHYFKSAADEQYPDAYVKLAECYESGIGVKSSLEHAASYYVVAARNKINYFTNAASCYAKLGEEFREEYQDSLKFYRDHSDKKIPSLSQTLKNLKEQRKFQDYIDIQDFRDLIEERIRDFELENISNPSNAWVLLGDKYRLGSSVLKSEKQAFRCYLHAAMLDNGYAYLILGYCYDRGIGIEPSFELALENYQKAYQRGVTEGLRYLSFAFSRSSIFLNKSKELINKYYAYRNSQADRGFLTANMILGLREILGDYFFLTSSNTRSEKRAFNFFSNMASQDDWLGWLLKGLAYIKSWSVNYSKEYAQECFTRAASKSASRSRCIYSLACLALEEKSTCLQEQGEHLMIDLLFDYKIPVHIRGKIAYRLGIYYKTNNNFSAAERHLALAIFYEYTDALLVLAELLEENSDSALADTQVKIFNLYKKATDLGYFNYWIKLGFLYEHGIGIEKSPKNAFKCYLTAKEYNLRDGYLHIARCYEQGLGVKQSYELAAQEYLNIASKGYFQGYRLASLCYEKLGEEFREERDECVKLSINNNYGKVI